MCLLHGFYKKIYIKKIAMLNLKYLNFEKLIKKQKGSFSMNAKNKDINDNHAASQVVGDSVFDMSSKNSYHIGIILNDRKKNLSKIDEKLYKVIV